MARNLRDGPGGEEGVDGGVEAVPERLVGPAEPGLGAGDAEGGARQDVDGPGDLGLGDAGVGDHTGHHPHHRAVEGGHLRAGGVVEVAEAVDVSAAGFV